MRRFDVVRGVRVFFDRNALRTRDTPAPTTPSRRTIRAISRHTHTQARPTLFSFLLPSSRACAPAALRQERIKCTLTTAFKVAQLLLLLDVHISPLPIQVPHHRQYKPHYHWSSLPIPYLTRKIAGAHTRLKDTIRHNSLLCCFFSDFTAHFRPLVTATVPTRRPASALPTDPPHTDCRVVGHRHRPLYR